LSRSVNNVKYLSVAAIRVRAIGMDKFESWNSEVCGGFKC